MMHGTPWFCEGVGAPAAASGRTAGAWTVDGGSVPSRRLFESLRLSLEASVCPRRGQGADGQARARASSQTVGGSMSATVGIVADRGRCLWVSQRTVDLESRRRGDPAGVRGILSPQSRMATASPTLLVLSSAGMAGHAAGRGCHSPLEAPRLAEYNKDRK